MKQFIAFFALGALFIFGACQQGPTPPEDVVRQWQAYIDANNFDEAKKLSTQATADLLDLLAGMMPPEMLEQQMGKTQVLEVNCNVDGEKAICDCKINYDGQTENDEFYLTLVDGQWKVDLPENPLMDGEVDFNEADLEGIDMEELEQMIEEEAGMEKEAGAEQ